METIEKQHKSTLNPWFSIWIKPRETMKEIFIFNAGNVFLLILIGSFVQFLDRASFKSAADSLSSPSALIPVGISNTLIGTLIYYFLIPVLLNWVGRKLGGQGTIEKIRYSVAYSFIPFVYSLVIVWVPSFFLFGIENFTTETPRLDSSITLIILIIIFGIIETIIGIWTIFIFLKCLGEAHQFSAWKALLTTVLSFMVIILPLIIIVFLVAV
ncbi:Yip1 family protein [Pseudalkalibacillus salsuginis]|uniref:Yip1 family protein n=1 Tax=Pseudalkalibacillus salsuginis TaxID=2910972 RepID=UPI001F44AD31|nr:Yip1 family protein [Pseudalkalibacillus salsuginis]MCF6410681.1 YIP1 family protein [Pseudalkalibacillus salsuginis]